jgi:hypothetical protein
MSNTTEPGPYNYARATSGNTIQGARQNATVEIIRSALGATISDAIRFLDKDRDGQNFDAIVFLKAVAAQVGADDALCLKLHNASGARAPLAAPRPAEAAGIVLEPGAIVAKPGSPADLGASMTKTGGVV